VLHSVSVAVLDVPSPSDRYLCIKDSFAGSDPLVLAASHSDAFPIPDSRPRELHAMV
jgi:hypothetical protein